MAVAQLPLPQDEGRHLPFGRRIELPRRGTTFIREVAGPPGAPTVLLLHGWVASSGLNWYQTFEPLARHFNVVAVDMRGHARGLRTRRIFRLADCADDCAATLVETGHGPAIVVGYSMGGPVAQLMWRRHRDLVDGLVLCATSGGFIPNPLARTTYQMWMFGWATVARAVAQAPIGPAVPVLPFATNTMPAWAAAEVRRHDWRMIVEAGHSLSTYRAGHWLGEIDVPTSVVCTTEDRAVSPSLQLETADAIRGARVYRFADGHLACANPRFGEPLVRACLDVAARAR